MARRRWRSECPRHLSRAVLVVAGSTLALVLAACGGGSPAAPAPAPTTSSSTIQNSCAITVPADQLEREVGAGATSFKVPITAPAGCAWTASTTSTFLSFAGGSGTGPGALEIIVAGNTGSERAGTVRIGAVTLSVRQGAATPAPPSNPAGACTYNVSPLRLSVSAEGGTSIVQVEVTNGADCHWIVETADSHQAGRSPAP